MFVRAGIGANFPPSMLDRTSALCANTEPLIASVHEKKKIPWSFFPPRKCHNSKKVRKCQKKISDFMVAHRNDAATSNISVCKSTQVFFLYLTKSSSFFCGFRVLFFVVILFVHLIIVHLKTATGWEPSSPTVFSVNPQEPTT